MQLLYGAHCESEFAESLRAYARGTLDEDHVCGPLPTGVTSREYTIRTWRIAGHIRDGKRLDRANGLLFTGDTYYSGEIYLWAPETNAADYHESIGKLGRLEPDLAATDRGIVRHSGCVQEGAGDGGNDPGRQWLGLARTRRRRAQSGQDG